ncbi:MAG TPA: hypothetical protein DCY25_11175 [Bacteroidales bacterium]|nr:hypothetical protein [Bacteroidales bacterium]
MNEWRLIIENLLNNALPGENSHRKMLPPERDLQIPNSNQVKILESGVLLMVIPSDNELYTCLIKRPGHMKIHAGQIGFPGGRQEPQDLSAQETAIRETYEEIGIDPGSIQVIGPLSPLYISVSNYRIHPFVAWTAPRPSFTLNPDEVEKLMFFPLLGHLKEQNREFRTLDTFSGKLSVPGIAFEDEFIWGATAMILCEFLDILSRHDPTRE